jgi:rhodanese-related sulfurtransferase
LLPYHTNLPAGFYGIAPADALKAMQAEPKPVIVDVREASEITPDSGWIAGAINIPIRVLAQNLDKLPKDKPLLLYCGSGLRSAIAVDVLGALDYTNMKSITGGIAAWKTANLPVTKEGTPPALPTTMGTKPTVNADTLAALDKYLTSLPAGFYGVPSADVLKELQGDKKPFLLDVREPKELTDNGKLEGAVNVPIKELISELDKLPKDKAAPIVVYCAVGHRGAMAMTSLRLLGHTNVRSLSGGFNAWVAAKLPTVK